jgi:hypothetical protein
MDDVQTRTLAIFFPCLGYSLDKFAFETRDETNLGVWIYYFIHELTHCLLQPLMRLIILVSGMPYVSKNTNLLIVRTMIPSR